MPYEGINGVSTTLNHATPAEAEKVFAALSASSQVTMPMQPAFWAACWAMLVDKFGAAWIVNGEPKPF